MSLYSREDPMPSAFGFSFSASPSPVISGHGAYRELSSRYRISGGRHAHGSTRSQESQDGWRSMFGASHSAPCWSEAACGADGAGTSVLGPTRYQLPSSTIGTGLRSSCAAPDALICTGKLQGGGAGESSAIATGRLNYGARGVGCV